MRLSVEMLLDAVNLIRKMLLMKHIPVSLTGRKTNLHWRGKIDVNPPVTNLKSLPYIIKLRSCRIDGIYY